MIDVWVTGSSLPALDAALSLAEVGLKVRVSVGEADTELPVGPQRDPDGAIAAMVARVGAPLPNTGNHPAPTLRKFPPAPVLLRGVDGALHPLSESAVVGIPTSPLAAEVIALLGTGGAFRAYLDRVKPVLKIGKERSLGVLVSRRLGAKAERVLVDPLVRERTGAATSEVDAAMVVPGLNEALTRVGSLTGGALAYGDRNVARETTVEPEGGWVALREALLTRLALYSVELVTDQAVAALGKQVDGEGWAVRAGAGDTAIDAPVRAVIVDVGGSPRLADAQGFADDPALAAPATRAYVEIGIERPSWLPLATDLPDLPALLVLPTSAGPNAGPTDGWTARVSRREGVWMARFSGPRRVHGSWVPKPDVEALCAAAGVTTTAGAEVDAVRGITVAPLISVEHDHARQLAIAAFDAEHPALRAVGEGWTGGDLALALTEAAPRVVELRRSLLGLA